MKQRILLLAKIILPIGVVWLALRRVDAAEISALVRMVPPSLEASILTCLMLQMSVLAALRARILLCLLGSATGLSRLVQVVWTGFFFEQAALNFIGGDLARLFVLNRIGVPTMNAAHYLVIDRSIGLFSLLLLALTGTPLFLRLLPPDAIRPLVFWVAVLAVGGCLLLLALSHPRLRHPQIDTAVRRFIASLSLLVQAKCSFAVVAALALTTQLINIGIFYVLGGSLGMPLSVLDWLTLLPAVMFFSMLPISIAGWGVREGAMIVALGIYGIPPVQAIVPSILFGLSVLASSLPGGIIWLLVRGGRRDDGAKIIARDRATAVDASAVTGLDAF